MATTGLKPETARPGGEDDRVLFGDADVEEPLRIFRGERVKPRPLGHGRRDGQDLGVGLGFGEHRLAEDLRIGRDLLVIQRLARRDVERPRAVEALGVALGRGVAAPFLGDAVEHDRARRRSWPARRPR